MKLHLSIILFLSAFCKLGIAQQSIFHKIYGGTNFASARTVLQCPDTSLIMIGSINTDDGNMNDFLFLKVDTNGNVLTEKKHGGSDIDFANWATFNHDSTAIMAVGYTGSFSNQDYDVYIVYLDLNGDTLWTKSIGGDGWDMANHVLNTSDKGFLISGETFSYGAGNNDMFIIKIDTNGTVEWEQTIGGALQDNAMSAVEIANNHFIIVGSSLSYSNHGKSQIFAVCLDAFGDSIWAKTYGGTDAEAYGTTNCLYTPSAGVILGGYGITHETDSQYFYIIDYNGVVQRSEQYSAIEIRFTVLKNEPNNAGFYYIIQRKDYTGAATTVFIVQYSPAFYFGNLRAYEANKNTLAYNVTKLFDGGYVIVGETESCALSASTAIFLYKVNQSLLSTVKFSNNCSNTVDLVLSIDEKVYNKTFEIFPNPVDINQNISVLSQEQIIKNIEMYDIHGRKVKSQLNINDFEGQINTSGLPSGMYFVNIQTENHQITKKIILK